MTPLESRLAGALWRVYARIEALAERAHEERIAQVAALREHFNRCAGQRLRRLQERANHGVSQ